MSKYEKDYPSNHQYKKYLGETGDALWEEGIEGESFGAHLESTKMEADLPERIIKSTR